MWGADTEPHQLHNTHSALHSSHIYSTCRNGIHTYVRTYVCMYCMYVCMYVCTYVCMYLWLYDGNGENGTTTYIVVSWTHTVPHSLLQGCLQVFHVSLQPVIVLLQSGQAHRRDPLRTHANRGWCTLDTGIQQLLVKWSITQITFTLNKECTRTSPSSVPPPPFPTTPLWFTDADWS